MDEAGVESVAGGNALEHVDVVSRGEPVLAALGVIEHAHPDGALDAGDVANDRGDLLAAVLGADLTGHLDVGVALLDAMGKGAGDTSHAEAGRCVLVVGDADVDERQELLHGCLRLLGRPHLAAVVNVAHGGDALGTASGESVLAGGGHLVGDGGRHTREVEDVDALEDLVPVKDVALGHVDGRVLAVVDAAVAALRSADLKHIGAKTVALTHDARGVDVVDLQGAQRALAQAVGRNDGNISGLVALVGQGKCGVCLGAAVADIELGGLLNTQVIFGREPHHDLAEGKNRFTHGRVAPSCLCVHLCYGVGTEVPRR